jgi:hypothetical protein
MEHELSFPQVLCSFLLIAALFMFAAWLTTNELASY